MDNYKIERGIPIPKHDWSRVKYPFVNMDIHESVFIPEEKTPNNKLVTVVSVTGKRMGRKYVTRKREEEGVKGTRVWRVE
jgi:hypothetical protein